jgi:hypothetical protein
LAPTAVPANSGRISAGSKDRSTDDSNAVVAVR